MDPAIHGSVACRAMCNPLCKRAWRLLICLWVMGAMPRPALAQADFQGCLGKAVYLYEELDYERALDELQKVRRLARTVEQEVAVSLQEGIVLGDMGQREQSQAAFKKALFLSPEANLPLKVSPKLMEDFELARAQVRAELRDSSAAAASMPAMAAPIPIVEPPGAGASKPPMRVVSHPEPPKPPSVAGPAPPRQADSNVTISKKNAPAMAEAGAALDRRHTLDFGVGLGINSPSGVLGLEAEYRTGEHLGFNLGGGFGAWGFRVSPTMRLYLFGIGGVSPFMEGGLSLNMGGGEVNAAGLLSPERNVRQFFTPVATTSLGIRFNLSRVYFTPRMGWGLRLRDDNYKAVDGQALSDGEKDSVNLYQHGGFLFSLTAGLTFL